MAIYQIESDQIVPVQETSFSSEGIRERGDLQRLLRDRVELLDPEIMVLAEEYGEWEDSRRRIDLLALDRDANLVVIELKRTDDGGHMELQAVRYAAMVSTLTFEKAAAAHSGYLGARGRDEDPRQALLDFLEWDEVDEDQFGQETRIILASSDFSREITTAVMWLNGHGIDIRCVRLRPYKLENRLLVDVQQIIPLPEAAEYQVQIREKESRGRDARKQKVFGEWTGKLYVNIGEGPHRNWDDCKEHGFLSAGQGKGWRDQIRRLQRGDLVYAYLKGSGYVGFGEVTAAPVMARNFKLPDGRPLLDLPLAQPGMAENAEDAERSEWVAAVRWISAVPREEARTFSGIFANQNVVCRLRDAKTLDFLAETLGSNG